MIILFLAVLILAVFTGFLLLKKNYEKTDYYAQTKNSYISMILDKGRRGEFYTYKNLKALKGYKRFLFNLYLPKENGETTEVDVVLHESGIYVLESKNYSGWIFGTESEQYWTQTLKAENGRTQKNRFFNPIIQNKVHLKWLQRFLADKTLPFYSYIVFSERCILKDIRLTGKEHYVIKRYDILDAVRQNAAKAGRKLSKERIDAIYKKLYPLTQADTAKKMAHIENVRSKQQKAGLERKNEKFVKRATGSEIQGMRLAHPKEK